MFASQFIKLLEGIGDDVTFVDLFGGSGLLSHIAKRCKPAARVIYNDYDNYTKRIEYIPTTNKLIADIRQIVADTVPKAKRIGLDLKKKILLRIQEEIRTVGYVDYITLSPSLLFSMKYATSYEELAKETFYNSIRTTDYPLAEDYLEGLEVEHEDYRTLFEQYKNAPQVVFLVDPPYLATDVKTYTMSWRLPDYLDVLTVLVGHSYVYFTSNKSSIIELCEWLGKNKGVGNPFEQAKRVEFKAHMNYNSKYTDMMLCSIKTA